MKLAKKCLKCHRRTYHEDRICDFCRTIKEDSK